MAQRWAAYSKSASGAMITGEMFPSSRVIFLIPAISVIRRPTSALPVKVTLATLGSETSHSPTVLPLPTTRFSAPAGSPASCMASQSNTALIGVREAGFRTTEFPAATAGASL